MCDKGSRRNAEKRKSSTRDEMRVSGFESRVEKIAVLTGCEKMTKVGFCNFAFWIPKVR